jgi:hypothetical protein
MIQIRNSGSRYGNLEKVEYRRYGRQQICIVYHTVPYRVRLRFIPSYSDCTLWHSRVPGTPEILAKIKIRFSKDCFGCH